MRTKMKIFLLMFLFLSCASFSIHNHVHGNDDVALRDAELRKYSTYYRLKDEFTKNGVKTWVYKRAVTDSQGNTCSRYIKIEKEYTLTICVNLENRKASSEVSVEELSREAVNGLD